ncbi:MAG: zinc ribbon domain-containing protein [Oscillospiraceae bacterium]|nr:zinc ribbon domain-containing protein [Oscillospiraceae bacterium]
MALIRCPECNREISDQAAACPGCGYPLIRTSPDETEEKLAAVKARDRLFLKRTGLILLGLIVLILALVILTTRGIL